LGFASGRRENKDVILALAEEFSTEDMQDSGLWKELGPNRQFHGWGIAGKKPEEQRRHRDDKWDWAWTDPVIIPYFNAAGELMKLRPHKGGAKGNTSAGRQMIYVPRRAGELSVEKHRTVVICEGEFKAAAIWQELGGGSGSKSPIGVCALPGITFSSNREIMADLESWLAETGARSVVVAYDDEDKADKPMKSRYAAPTWAVVMQVRLVRLGMTVRTAVLPREWQVERKADWDGALRFLLSANDTQSQ
jgi:hypothetical protein